MLRSRVGQHGVWFCALACVGASAALSCGGQAADDRPGTGSPSAPLPGTALPGSTPPGGSGPPVLTLPQQETCEDNPLLAGCPVSTAPVPSIALSPSAQPSQGSTRSSVSTVGAVENLLFDHCGACHGGLPSPERCGTCDGMYGVENLRMLIQTGEVVPCRWPESRLYKRVADGSMPPAGSSPALSPAELRQVGDVVNGLCAQLTEPSTENPDGPEIERWLAADCGSCHGAAADAGAAPAPNGIDGVGDLSELIQAGLIVPCDADGSELVRVLRDGSMPPPGASGSRPGRAQITELMTFIDRPCSRR